MFNDLFYFLKLILKLHHLSFPSFPFLLRHHSYAPSCSLYIQGLYFFLIVITCIYVDAYVHATSYNLPRLYNVICTCAFRADHLVLQNLLVHSSLRKTNYPTFCSPPFFGTEASWNFPSPCY